MTAPAAGAPATCLDCSPLPTRLVKLGERQRGTGSERGYGWTWRKLSERARARQPFCTDCGTSHDLTTDHLAEAWRRYNSGRVIRLTDVDVVCRECNTARGEPDPDDPDDTATRRRLAAERVARNAGAGRRQ